tara:strand:- start:1788 stop:2426 length:639 start_codon:yes stop_codon:yes gene_type:complete
MEDEISCIQDGGGGDVNNSFINYMFTMSDNEKDTILNIIQYTSLSIVPLIIIIKLMNVYLPKYNEHKGNIEILIEVILQLIFTIIFLWFINKFILYIPTYSKTTYENINIMNMILPIIFILFTLETNINKKVILLSNKLMLYLGFQSETMIVEKTNEEDISNYISDNYQNIPDCKLQQITIQEPIEKKDFLSQDNPMEISNEPVAANTFSNF